ncbi:hypothetical protein CYLTODRAFT_417976 [Cylindrobasidium torrendii FP15055 ss-10]|uniref:Uncharacterized protein n=1 Tax=Cylindrobasidium torrendii FP15055 ss-10 TaxID=1314674 RepID=A0A0D7BQE6_9AGAR|nr:hypothetical protein CYLTODRAFT_417976 [Cylindrobasidium torrendii FP15055 ss-10]
MSQSLLDTLTKFDKPSDYPAMEMIESLIRILASSVASAQVSRNTHTLCTAISRALDVCNQTSALITKSLTEDVWDSFLAYSKQIDPLEDYLLKLAVEVLDADYLEKSTSAVLNLDTWINDNWEAKRKTVDEAYHALYTDEKFTGAMKKEDVERDHKALRIHDDDTFLDELIRLFGSKVQDSSRLFGSRVWNTVKTFRDELKKSRDSLLTQANARDEEAVTYLTNIALVANGVAEVATKSTDPKSPQALNLRSNKVWKPTETLLKLVVKTDAESKAELKKEWDKWIQLLKDLTPEGIDVKRLKELLSYMRPSYFLQALELIKACRELVKKQAEDSSIALDDVKQAVEDVVTALTKIKSAKTNDDEAHSTLKTAATELQAILSDKSVELEGGKSLDKAVGDGKTTDMERFNRWEARIKANPSSEAKEIELTVNVSGITGVPSQVVKVGEKATLDIVLWKLSSLTELSSKKATMQKWRFKGGSDNSEMSLSQKVEGLTTVELVIA